QPLPSANSGASSGQWKQSDQGGGNQVEAFRPGQPSSGGGSDIPVPQPRDPGEPSSSARPNGQQDDPFSSPLGMNGDGPIELQGIDDQTASTDAIDDLSAAPQPVVLRVPAEMIPADAADEDPNLQTDSFVTPIRLQSVSSSHDADAVQESKPSGQPHPFAYDRQNYRWLRGIVDYDESDNTWHLMYAAKPDPDDPYGGDITLADHPDLSKLRDGDIVLVEGRVDTASTDALGKPQYRIEKLVGPLVPKGATLADQN
ncbi:MAG: hypothetical protein GXP27_10400, partial [Planctomycetes bacterium]|nr:hypothetical protein [Planctomycetota bacterium]